MCSNDAWCLQRMIGVCSVLSLPIVLNILTLNPLRLSIVNYEFPVFYHILVL